MKTSLLLLFLSLQVSAFPTDNFETNIAISRDTVRCLRPNYTPNRYDVDLPRPEAVLFWERTRFSSGMSCDLIPDLIQQASENGGYLPARVLVEYREGPSNPRLYQPVQYKAIMVLVGGMMFESLTK